MSFKNKTKLFKLPFLLFFILLCCVPLTLNADVLNAATSLAHSNALFATGVVLTIVGLLRPFKRGDRQSEE